MTISIDASKHLVKAVTVFSSCKAEVVRTFTVDLEGGQNELSITSLSSCIDTDSARITGLGDAMLSDVICTIIDARDIPPSSDGDVLEALERRREMLEGEKKLCSKASDMLAQYGRSMAAEYTTPDTVTLFADSLVQRGAKSLEEAKALDEQIADLDKELEKERRRLQKERQKPAARGRVTAVIVAKRARKIEVTFTYVVSNASWSPSYDLRAITEDGKHSHTVSLHYCASIQQNTGEDWRDTAISVSTAIPGTWSSIPSRRVMKISPGQSTLAVSKNVDARKAKVLCQHNVRTALPSRLDTVPFRWWRAAAAAYGHEVDSILPLASSGYDWQSVGPQFYEAILESEAAVASDHNDATWAETKTIVTESSVVSSFRIDGNCTVSSALTAHRVAIALLSFDVKVNYISVPRSTPMSFLQCEVKNTSQYRLLPGSVNVFLDNSPVSKTTINIRTALFTFTIPFLIRIYTQIKDINPDEIFMCTLGPDPALRIKCTRMPPIVTTSGSLYVAQTKITTYKICTIIQNGHSFPVTRLVVHDAAPSTGETTDNKEIKVVVKLPEGLAEAAPDAVVDVPNASVPGKSSVKVHWERKSGVKEANYVWLVDLGPGEEVNLEAEYKVRAPEDYVWHMLEEHFS
ncbi:uncharacterized protein FOMMEDRAFT_80022 [Fomitiporia mediterranea MF3/22]|uniref:uncharacterized protein n=1 Tax=Fomitiporia mediterranea (strain MF3/22) TaxID=694068 RepID=UPI0004407654|nr:uncharacterized protein FOMMEDRAFT_80022 [Fomitiporia mediterranea MF3/22]EJD04807.1 hypothetical protein FOMMEDRAFT_80022 [Fomitiporia mediterranea MF3/22]